MDLRRIFIDDTRRLVLLLLSLILHSNTSTNHEAAIAVDYRSKHGRFRPDQSSNRVSAPGFDDTNHRPELAAGLDKAILAKPDLKAIL